MSISDTQYQQWLERSGNYRCALIRLTFLGAAVGSPSGSQEYHAFVTNMPYVTQGAPDWDIDATYAIDDLVTADGVVYVSLRDDNNDVDPTGGGAEGWWAAVDLPANQIFDQCVIEAPAFTSRMGEQLEGRSQQSYGDLTLSNPTTLNGVQLTAGERDDWYSMNWDGRAYRKYLGDPAWQFSDFRSAQVGTLVDVYDPGGYKLGFKISDKAPLLDRPVMTQLVGGTGPRAGELMPLALGEKLTNITPKYIDDANLIYRITATDGTEELFTDHNDWYERPQDVRENGISLSLGNSITAVDNATETLTTLSPHGYSENTRVYFANQGGSSLPTPLVDSPFGSARTYYWVVAAGLTSNDFRVSATRGGSTLDITGVLGGTPFVGAFKWDYLDDGTFQLAQATEGTITCDVHGLAVSGVESNTAADIIEQVLTSGLTNTPFTAADLDAVSFAAFKILCPQKLSIYLTEQITFAELLDRLVLSVGGWWGFSEDGLLTLGRLDLPSADTPTYSFINDDVARRSMKISRRILPRAEVKLAGVKNWTQQDTLAGDVTPLLRAYYAAPGATKTGAASVTGWDTDPVNHLRAARPDAMQTYLVDETELQDEADRLATMLQYPTVIWAFQTHQAVFLLSIGSLIYVDTARFTGYGIVVGFTKRVKGRSDIEFFAQLPDLYPTADIA
jgi:hypothetical protein